MVVVLIRRRRFGNREPEDTQTWRRRPCDYGGRDWNGAALSQKQSRILLPPEGRTSQVGVFLEPAEGARPCPHMISDV